ncbi:MAG: cation:proton antiporter [Cyanobacteria bacterium Co-bin13]|nr:cation:proton antiporter [Cyanobacteria bacterium Co-bin13]
MDAVLAFFRENPIGLFTLLLAIILTIPPLFKQLRLPDLVGLLAAGLVFGPHGLGWLNNESEAMSLLSDIGVVYLLFVAGLEIDMEEFRKIRHRSMGFGLLTFSLPLLTGTLIGRSFGFGWNAALLMGSLLASHTPLGYPIVRSFGAVRDESVIVTIGGTIFTDIGALLVLALCVALNTGDLTLATGVQLLGAIALYVFIVLFSLNRIGRAFFRRSGDNEGNQFLFILLALFLAAVGAEVVGIEKIVGAFLAGLAVNSVVPEGPVKEKVIFVGSVLFIPIFFVDMGLLIDPPAFIRTLSAIWLCLSIVVGLISSKFAAAFLTRLLYRYSWPQTMTIWSLSLPQVAATLAATLVGYRVGLLNDAVLNSVLVLMLVTATLGPFITAQAVPRLLKSAPPRPLSPDTTGTLALRRESLTLLVPVANPLTEQPLIHLAARLVQGSGKLLPLAVTIAHASLGDEQLTEDVARSQQLLDRAEEAAQVLQVQAQPLLRIDDNIAQAITRSAREQRTDLILMGWGKTNTLQTRLFGSIIDSVCWSAHCPVAVTRLVDDPGRFQRILVPLKDLSEYAIEQVQLAERLALSTQGQITLLHVYHPRTPTQQIVAFKAQLAEWINAQQKPPAEIELVPSTAIAQVITRFSRAHDLVILRTTRRQTAGGLMAASDVTNQLVADLACSVMMLSDPPNLALPLSPWSSGLRQPPPEDPDASVTSFLA